MGVTWCLARTDRGCRHKVVAKWKHNALKGKSPDEIGVWLINNYGRSNYRYYVWVKGSGPVISKVVNIFKLKDNQYEYFHKELME